MATNKGTVAFVSMCAAFLFGLIAPMCAVAATLDAPEGSVSKTAQMLYTISSPALILPGFFGFPLRDFKDLLCLSVLNGLIFFFPVFLIAELVQRRRRNLRHVYDANPRHN
jgi:hypothetical protein